MRAQQQVDLRIFIQKQVLAALRKTAPAQASEEDVMAWLSFVQAGETVPAVREELGINRYLEQKRLLEERIAKLKKALESNERQLQNLYDFPAATEYLSSYVHLQNVALPFVDTLISKVHEDRFDT